MKSFYLKFMKKSGMKNLSAALGFIFSIAILANAAPPANDNFANAQTISGMNGQSVMVSNTEATTESGEPSHALNRGGRSVWYKYTATGNGSLQIATTGSFFDTLLAVYEGTSLSNLKLVATNDNIEDPQFSCICSRLRIGTMTGKTYYIAVDGKYSGNGSISTGDATVNFVMSNVSANDNFANAELLPFATGKLKTTTNVGASKEPGEPNHAGNAGGKSVWYKWTAPAGIARTYSFTVENYALDQSSPNKQVLFAIYTGTSVNSLVEVARGNSYSYSKIVFTPVAGTTYYIAIDGKDNGAGAMLGTFLLDYGVNKSDKVPDVDGDGLADLTVFRPTTGTFYSFRSITDKLSAHQWGTNGDKPLIVDKNYDGKIDYTVFRPDTGVWYIDRSDVNAFEIFNWGINTDIPMYRRYLTTSGTNNGIPTVFRPNTGTWYLYFGANTFQTVNWGLNGDIPVLADFTGDGVDDITVFRPSTGTWYILLDQFSFEFRQVQFGLNGDKPVVADYDGDGRADVAVYRPSNGTWYVLRSSDGGFQAAQFGISTDKPQPADYDGDSKADYAVYRNGIWWILQTSNNQAKAVSFGLSSDVPLTAPAN